MSWPLSKPIMATLALFVAVGYWNSFFEAIMYIRATDRWTLQLVLREIVMSSNTQMLQTGGNLAEPGQNHVGIAEIRDLDCGNRADYVRLPVPAEVLYAGRYGRGCEGIKIY